MFLPPTSSTLFPYTTLFRSRDPWGIGAPNIQHVPSLVQFPFRSLKQNDTLVFGSITLSSKRRLHAWGTSTISFQNLDLSTAIPVDKLSMSSSDHAERPDFASCNWVLATMLMFAF